DFAAARDNLEKAATFWQQAYPADDVRLGNVANNLGFAWQALGESDKAEASYARALAIHDKGTPTLELARTLNNLGTLLQTQGRLNEAEQLFNRAVGICGKVAGSDALLGQALNNQAVLYLLRKDYGQAGPLYERALELRQRALGADHPDVATSLAA